MKIAALFFMLLTVTLTAQTIPIQAPTNVIEGNVVSFNRSPRSTLDMTLTLSSPKNRTINGQLVSNDPIITTSDTNGYFSFTNVCVGKYRLNPSDLTGSYWTLYVGTNTYGTWPIAALVTNQAAVPPDNGSVYYTASQVDALIASVEAGTAGNYLTNNAPSATFGTLIATNIDLSSPGSDGGLRLYTTDNDDLHYSGSGGNGNFVVDAQGIKAESFSGSTGPAVFIGDGSQLTFNQASGSNRVAGVGITNGAVFATTFTGNGAGLTNIAGLIQGWVNSQNFSAANIQRNDAGVVTNCPLLYWPDGATGSFLTTSNNTTYNTIDSYVCTYTNGIAIHGFTQSTILRNSLGAATNVPALVQNY